MTTDCGLPQRTRKKGGRNRKKRKVGEGNDSPQLIPNPSQKSNMIPSSEVRGGQGKKEVRGVENVVFILLSSAVMQPGQKTEGKI